MSSTKRGAVRARQDFYPTPGWAVRRLLAARQFAGGRWLEPCAGDGAIIRAVERKDVTWTAVEIRKECRSALTGSGAHAVQIRNFLELAESLAETRERFDLTLTNPPFTDAMEFVEAALRVSHRVAMLLRLNFLASGKRNGFMRSNCPDVYVLPDRPSFTGKGTDSIEYGWFVWDANQRRAAGRIQVLEPTPLEEKRHALTSGGRSARSA